MLVLKVRNKNQQLYLFSFVFPEFILRAFQTVVLGISSDILISEGSHLKSMLRTVNVRHTNKVYISVYHAHYPPEGKR